MSTMQASSSNIAQEVQPRKFRVYGTVDEAIRDYFTYDPPTLSVIIYGPIGIGKTTNVIKHAKLEAEKLGKVFVDLTAEFAGRSPDEAAEKALEIRENKDNYYIFYMIQLGSIPPDALMAVPAIVELNYKDKETGKERRVKLRGDLLSTALWLFTTPGIHGALLVDDAAELDHPIKESFIKTLFQERRFGGAAGVVSVSDNVRIIGTANWSEDSELSKPFPRTMVGRAQFLAVEPVKLEDWAATMKTVHGDRFDDTVIAFLMRYRNYYCRPDMIMDEPPVGPVPRSWEKVGLILKPRLEKFWAEYKQNKEKAVNQLISAVAGYVGPQVAGLLASFIEKKPPSVYEFLENPEKYMQLFAGDLDLAARFTIHTVSLFEHAVTGKLSSNEKVRVKLDDSTYYTTTASNPHIYLVALTKLMTQVSKDYGVFAIATLTQVGKEKIRELIASGPETGDKSTSKGMSKAERLWQSEIENAKSYLIDVLIDLGILGAISKRGR